ncbi:ComF family protein [Rufibacter glacialis]|uniref:ComF family protein n=1 Tax=Rufibacter glacialis TaxID=1259555 RepID=A0A5M8QC59_9BACT|nr:ComF family protein [Rufibacter glacialis]KAA6433569.1 ComF family protein [Rufibacter glacialis]GGK72943.1 amidophosphoribosyltransferase [Rufibacter glacialis]
MSQLQMGFRTLYHDFLALLFPEDCRACGGELALGEEVICSHCRIKLPYTHFHLSPTHNALHEVFWGRVPLQLAVAYLKFQEKGRVQRLLHQLKYRGQEEVGELLGRWFGAQLKEQPEFHSIDVVVPVPLHKSKLRQRGYNQVTGFAQALGQHLEVPLAADVLLKNQASSSQTRKNRQARWEAMQHLYGIQQPWAVEGKHVLLVDDVITTGATIEACAELLLRHGARAVSVASMAYTL